MFKNLWYNIRKFNPEDRLLMKKFMMFWARQTMKMLLQNTVLPCVYGFWRFVYRNQEPSMIIFADAHHNKLPVSMKQLCKAVQRRGHTVTDFYYNFAEISPLRSALLSVRFMRLYAQAKYVFICDNFLPVSSCKKSCKTTVVQLWHACGLMKKMGYDTAEDIPIHYKGSVYRNYDIVTVSAPCCVEPMSRAMHLPEKNLRPLGVSRTDVYFNPEWLQRRHEQFYEMYPQARGKKIVLWAPTFRGNASDPYQVGMEDILQLEEQLGEDYFVIRKVHPHVDEKLHLSNCAIITERLLPVTDLLITDYSTVLTEYLFFEKPYVLFAPDLPEYQDKRGFYVEYETLSPYIVTEPEKLYDACIAAMENPDRTWIARQREFHVASCDGKSTERIIETLGL